MQKPKRPKKPHATKPKKPSKKPSKTFHYFNDSGTIYVVEDSKCEKNDWGQPILKDLFMKMLEEQGLMAEYNGYTDSERSDWLNEFMHDVYEISDIRAEMFDKVEELTGISKYEFRATHTTNIDGYLTGLIFTARVELSDEEYQEALNDWERECAQVDQALKQYKEALEEYKIKKAEYDIFLSQEKLKELRK